TFGDSKSFGFGPPSGFAISLAYASYSARSFFTRPVSSADRSFFSPGSSFRLYSSTRSFLPLPSLPSPPALPGAPTSSFQSPERMAPPPGAALSKILSCGDGLPLVIVGQTSLPSSGSFCFSDPPSRPTSVGYQSTTCIGSSTTVPALMCPCQQANAGTRTPPAYRVALPPRSGTLLATLPGC